MSEGMHFEQVCGEFLWARVHLLQEQCLFQDFPPRGSGEGGSKCHMQKFKGGGGQIYSVTTQFLVFISEQFIHACKYACCL